jgi:predicted RNase H-like nuclease (RuvC/YqgF family)
MDELKFLHKYNDTAVDNFVSVVKQNIVFQAQLAYLSDENAAIPELRKRLEEIEPLKTLINNLQQENVNLKNDLNSKISIIESANKSDTEKYRLQTAVNNQMRENETLKQNTLSLQKQLKEKEEYIARLEEMLPKTARKKLGLEVKQETTKEETTVDNETKDTLSNGGDF